MKWLPLAILLAAAIIATIGDILLKKWIITKGTWLYILGILMYLIAANFLAQSFRYKNIAVASIIYVVINIIILSVVSWFYFKETLNTMQIAGIVLGLVSVIVLELA